MRSVTMHKYTTRFKNKRAAMEWKELYSEAQSPGGICYRDWIVMQIRHNNGEPAGWTLIPKENKENPNEQQKALELILDHTMWHSYQVFLESNPTLREFEGAEWLSKWHSKYKKAS